MGVQKPAQYATRMASSKPRNKWLLHLVHLPPASQFFLHPFCCVGA